ncbi:glutamate 5-kinase [Pisciglobus halotolerans]|uniref:Glutamate 5-kinase n=1 Tax=Pisciglobus halotolerans TaxID=745365 RepID=A0A1I3CMD8_9LACT|nr:glutamate 5-kinase [Pisciglobus halotolerans]SFH75657.1 glutamate 5-kinase [Pisciglobus halotolerans]
MTKTARKRAAESKRIVVKVGTSTIMYPNGTVNLQRLDRLTFVLSDLNNQGKEVILVSSGAIGVGMNRLHLQERPQTIPGQQAVAAVGQSELMSLYSQFFHTYGKTPGQILMTRDIIEFPESRENAINTFNALLETGVIPIVNENDSVSVEELDHLTKFGDNDQLSAIVSEITDADLLIMLTDVDGFYDKNPLTHEDASLFKEISQLTDQHYALAGGNGSRFGTGGMATKLKAAHHMMQLEKQMALANGKEPAVILDIINGTEIGTLFTT